MTGPFWSLLTIVGPVLLALAIIVAMRSNRRSRAEKLQSEQAVRDQHNADRREEGLPPKVEPVMAEKR